CCKQFMYLGEIFFKCLNYIFYFPYKNAGIPQKFATGQERFCDFKAGLFCKCLHFINVVTYFILLNLYIPVTCVGMVWLNAQSEQRIVLTNKIQRLVTYFFKSNVLHHQMI